jgi:myo-inositol-1(or 4)-monophosphatase
MKKTENTAKYQKFAKSLLLDAVRELNANRSRFNLERPKRKYDVVTSGDLFIQEYIYDSLKKNFPSHGLISEESLTEQPDAEYVWILDPIDGTKYFVKNIPLYSISLALKFREQLILGIVYGPRFDQMFYCEKGKGAKLNGRSIRCTNISDLDQANICLEIPNRYSTVRNKKWALEKMIALIDKAFRVRIIGVASLGLCWCAMGGFDAYINLGSATRLWDFAAGEIILREAGGEFTHSQGLIIAGGAPIVAQLNRIIGELPR